MGETERQTERNRKGQKQIYRGRQREIRDGERERQKTYKGENRDIGVQLGRGAGRESLNLGPEKR